MPTVDFREVLRNIHHPADFFRDPHGGGNNPVDWWTWEHLVPYSTTGVPPYQGLRSAVQSSDKRFGMTMFLDTTAGVNQVWEASRRWAIMPVSQGLPGFADAFGNPFFFSMRMNRGNPSGTSAGERYQGICWGDPWGINTPWQTNFLSAGNCGARVGLHFNHTNELWEVQLYVQDESPPEIIPCVYQAAFEVDVQIVELALLYVPPDSTGFNSRVVAILNDKVALDLHNNNKANQFGGNNQIGPGIYCTHGSGAGATCSETGLYTGRIWHPLPLPNPPR